MLSWLKKSSKKQGCCKIQFGEVKEEKPSCCNVRIEEVDEEKAANHN